MTRIPQDFLSRSDVGSLVLSQLVQHPPMLALCLNQGLTFVHAPAVYGDDYRLQQLLLLLGLLRINTPARVQVFQQKGELRSRGWHRQGDGPGSNFSQNRS